MAEKTQIKEFDKVESALAMLTDQYSIIPDVTTKEGYKGVVSVGRELAGYRNEADRLRKALGKPHRDEIKRIDTYAKGLISKIEAIESPIRAARAEEDARREQVKKERIGRLRLRISAEITSYLDSAGGLSSAEIADLLHAAKGVEVADYYDLTNDALDEHARVLRELESLHDRTLDAEIRERENAELRSRLAAAEAALSASATVEEAAHEQPDPEFMGMAKPANFEDVEEAIALTIRALKIIERSSIDHDKKIAELLDEAIVGMQNAIE